VPAKLYNFTQKSKRKQIKISSPGRNKTWRTSIATKKRYKMHTSMAEPKAGTTDALKKFTGETVNTQNRATQHIQPLT
jgi:hypothetical protein